MPITQARMISLLAAAQDYQRGLDVLIELVHDQYAMAENGRQSPSQALTNIKLRASTIALLQYPVDSLALLKIEAIHFAREGRRNNQRAAKARENRMFEAQGLGKPNRGDGRTTSHTSATQLRPILRPDLSATIRGHDFVGQTELSDSGEQLVHFTPQPLQPIPYTPGQLTESQKAKIAEDMKEIEAQQTILEKINQPSEPQRTEQEEREFQLARLAKADEQLPGADEDLF